MTVLMFIAAPSLGEPARQQALQTVTKANNAFAVALYYELADDADNLFFSPYSMYVALAMTAEGARGETAEEMGRVLSLPAELRRGGGAANGPSDMSVIHRGIAELSDQLKREAGSDEAQIRRKIDKLRDAHRAAQARVRRHRQQGNWQASRKVAQEDKRIVAELNQALSQVDQYELRIANALWGEKSYPFEEAYIQTIDRYYETGGVFQVDFKNSFPAARARINRWVADQTEGRIEDIIPRLSPAQARMLRLILTNAIYFKGEWSEPFEEKRTEPREFLLPDGGAVKTPIMHARALEVGRYAAFRADGSLFETPRKIERGQKAGLYPGEDGFAMLELPYKGGELAMVLIAPNSPDGLPAIERMLTAENLAVWTGRLVDRELHVFLPKFTLKTDYQMNRPLQEMGMVRAFVNPLGPDGADFSGMSASDDPMDRLYISQVLHKAFVEVNEKGTEAAAATAVMMAATAAPSTIPFTPTFKADRPFIFMIRDTASGAVLFLGRFVEPS